jgi:hypothetical protein
MNVEIVLFAGLIFFAATLAAKLIERRKDVLYGPYIQGRSSPSADLWNRLEAALGSIGLRLSFSRFALKIGTISYFASAIIG